MTTIGGLMHYFGMSADEARYKTSWRFALALTGSIPPITAGKDGKGGKKPVGNIEGKDLDIMLNQAFNK